MESEWKDIGVYVEIQPFQRIACEGADYSARLARAKAMLGAKWCLANPRQITNKHALPTPRPLPLLAEVRAKAKGAM